MSRRHRLIPYALGILAFSVYLTNLRPLGAGDSFPARLLPFSILREGNLDLDEFAWLRSSTPSPFFLKQDAKGHWRSKYPIVTPLLVTPLAVPFVQWSEAWQIANNDSRFRLLVAIFDRVAAAFVTACSVVLFCFAARGLMSVTAATIATLVYGFATNTWSISSQSLWQHGVTELAIAGAALCLLRGEGRRWAFATGAMLGLAVGARPQSAIVAGIVTIFFVVERRRDLAAFLLAPVLMVGLVIGYNLTLLQRMTGGYSTAGVRAPDLECLVGLLISPSRGLLVYCPLTVLAFAALRPINEQPRLLRYLAAAIVAYVLFFSGFYIWWAGHSYGPRFFADVMPLVVLCAMPTAQYLWRRRLGRAFVAACMVWGFAVQIIGVYCDDNHWNWFPASVDVRPERVWDWTDPQILRAARAGWHGGDFAPLLHQLVTDRTPAPLVPLEWNDLQASIEPVGALPWHFRLGGGGELHVRITNGGSAVWPAFSDWGELDVGILPLWKANGVVVQGVGEFQPLPIHLAPGAVTELHTWMEAPKRAGHYDLELNLVQNLGGSGRFGGATRTISVLVE